MADAVGGQRVADRVVHRRSRTDGARLADALGPERVQGRGRFPPAPLGRGECGRRAQEGGVITTVGADGETYYERADD